VIFQSSWNVGCYSSRLGTPMLRRSPEQSYTIPKMWLTSARRITATSWQTRLVTTRNNNAQCTSCSSSLHGSCSTIYWGDIKEKLYCARSVEPAIIWPKSLPHAQSNDFRAALLHILYHICQMHLYTFTFYKVPLPQIRFEIYLFSYLDLHRSYTKY
jgi:hypothetical protein